MGGPGRLLRAHTSAAERLIIEITETAAIQDIDDTRGFVTRVKDLGCRIAIDDFGAGYTSFRNLRKLGVDIVKIDGAFVQNIVKSDDDRAFVHTLIDLARRLGLKTVAEWVQDEAAAAMLAGLGLRLPARRADRARLRASALAARVVRARRDLGVTVRQARIRGRVGGYSLPPILSSRFCISSSWCLRSSMSPPAARLFGRRPWPGRARSGANMAKVFSNISMLRRT